MAKRKKQKRSKKTNALIPFTKTGVRVGTLAMEAGATYALFNNTQHGVPWDQLKAGKYKEAINGYVDNLSYSSNAGKWIWYGAGGILIARMLDVRGVGPIRFS